MNNTVPPGYKQTEVGVIPEEWEVAHIGEIAAVEGGYAYSSKKFLQSGKYQVVKMSNLYAGELNLERSASFLNELDDQERRYLLQPNDILITLTGTTGKQDYGFTYRINNEQNLLLNQRVARLVVNKSTSASYVAFQLKMNSFLRQFFDVSKGGTGNQTNVGISDVATITIPLPPLPEQRAIATALSDVDALITSLDKLIAKKRDMKQAAMQELLTGKRRLPGFSGEWEVKTIKAIVQTPVTDGPHLTPEFLNDGIPFLSVNNLVDNKIDHSDLRYISVEDHEFFSRKCKPQQADILLGKAASVGKVAIIDFDTEINIWSPIALIRISGNNVPKFIYYQLQAADLTKQITFLTNSSSQGNIGMGDIEKLELKLPSKDEQTAIAAILSDMDTEIAALEQKRDKTRLLKQGMMQELLTGRTRLV